MSEQDPLSNFLGNLAEKIKVTKEHKNIMEAVYASASGANINIEQEDPFTNFLKKIGNTISNKLPSSEVPIVETVDDVVKEEPKKDDATIALGNKIKKALQRAKTEPPKTDIQKEPVKISELKPEIKTQPDPAPTNSTTDENKSTRELGEKIRAAIEKAKENALNPVPSEETKNEDEPDEQIAGYIDELEKIKDTGTVKQQEEANTTLKELKEYIDKTVKDYSRKILDLGGGGGSVAVQYANGGTMNGDLNVNGHILSGGKNIANYFGTGGGGGGDPAVNSVVYTNSANWISDYTTTNYFSAFWNAAVDELFNFYVTQTDPGSAFISEDGNYYIIANSKLDNVDLWNNVFTQVFLLSSQWSSVYVTVLGNSARWESVYTSFNENSGRYNSVYNTTQALSGNWSSVYNTYQSLSASYAAETLAIAYAVAL